MAMGAALFLPHSDCCIFRLGTLASLDFDETKKSSSFSSLEDLQSLFEDTSEAYRLHILRDVRLRLPLSPVAEGKNLSEPNSQLITGGEGKTGRPSIKVFKPLFYSYDGSLASISLSTTRQIPTEVVIIRQTQVGILIVHFGSNVAPGNAIQFVEKFSLNLPILSDKADKQ
ncbi:unnamed protein product [Dibothriocephalus latus]|uniref:Uncharacterized protein n=1 Tax=Dibothriocephalus latus TaxID=60516 RepID=A0A3P7M776_DIBLA|nr:unnamed protein product [Dibothriocephalus latus]